MQAPAKARTAAVRFSPVKGWKGGRQAPRKAGAGERKVWGGCGRLLARQVAAEEACLVQMEDATWEGPGRAYKSPFTCCG